VTAALALTSLMTCQPAVVSIWRTTWRNPA